MHILLYIIIGLIMIYTFLNCSIFINDKNDEKCMKGSILIF